MDNLDNNAATHGSTANSEKLAIVDTDVATETVSMAQRPATAMPKALSVEELAERMASFTPKQFRYLTALPTVGTKRAAAGIAGIDIHTPYIWRSSVPGFREVDDAISQGNHLRTELAKSILQESSADAALKMVSLSQIDAKSDKELNVSLNASTKILESNGLLKNTSNVTVNVDARRIDVRAKQLWDSGGSRSWRDRHED
jgi:hypothetical protein